MNDYQKSLNAHYSRENLAEAIVVALAQSGKTTITHEDTAAFDEFHIRGRKATRELATLAGLKSGMRVLDIGCGIGGPARTLAAEFGCIVTGIDIVAEYCRAATLISEMVGMSGQVTFHQAHAGELPFAGQSFDAVWTSHLIINIADKAAFLTGVKRVLATGGLFAFYEICSGAVTPVHFPVPWAGDERISFPVAGEEFQRLLSAAGFTALHWEDVSATALVWFRDQLARAAERPAGTPLPPGLHLLMGENTAEKSKNVVRNLAEDRIRVIRGVCRVQR